MAITVTTNTCVSVGEGEDLLVTVAATGVETTSEIEIPLTRGQGRANAKRVHLRRVKSILVSGGGGSHTPQLGRVTAASGVTVEFLGNAAALTDRQINATAYFSSGSMFYRPGTLSGVDGVIALEVLLSTDWEG